MRKRKILVADLLCGAGGSSTGAARALEELGLDMDLVCVNHWQVAIDTHSKNHPEARHYCQDIATVRPAQLVPEGYLDLLMASPTCTHHSVARGGRPTSDQQRSDPWHIITWLTELRVKRIIIENVWEFTSWGPINARTGKPIKSRRGEYFAAWISALKALGFEVEWKKLNAADYGDATTRQRFILIGRSDRKKIRWPIPTHAKPRDGVDLFATLKPWRPARDIIDWSIKGRSIFDRKKPLAPATLARIYAGVTKFGWPEPFIVTLRNHMSAQGIDVPIPTIFAGGTHIGIAQPFVFAPGSTGAPRLTEDPLPTITTGGAGADRPGCARPIMVEPFLMSRKGEGAPRSVEEPTPTQVAKHSHCLISPYYGDGSGKTCCSADDPLPTIRSHGSLGMVVPVTHSDGSNRARDVSDPLPTLTTANRGELAFITASFGERDGQAPRTHPVEEPTPTICATGRVNLVQATPEFDILFRMLEPHELAAAMGFNGDDQTYEFTGTKTERIRQIGNAVSVAKMKACVSAVMSDEAVPAMEREPRRARAAI